ncbi:hypothetical protein K3495_g2470 [Podosphaera aphanis]|nr:hypothetical protein K3495_g2470 [Podosphaera aphanis]
MTSSEPGAPSLGSISVRDRVLEGGAALTQSFDPLHAICAHLNAFHVYASDPSRSVEANHYCSHISPDIRQCLIFDTPTNPARLIGVEYMITKKLYEGLDGAERRLWHSHEYEVKSGMLIMPNSTVPASMWEHAETEEMKEVIGLYGKTYHFWQVDRGDSLPLGLPQLMMSFTKDEQVPRASVQNRDQRLGVNTARKKEIRATIEDPQIHEDADSCWRVE